MRGFSAIVVAAALVSVTVADGPAAKWWAHVHYLADDALQGRDTGSAGTGLRPRTWPGSFAPSGSGRRARRVFSNPCSSGNGVSMRPIPA